MFAMKGMKKIDRKDEVRIKDVQGYDFYQFFQYKKGLSPLKAWFRTSERNTGFNHRDYVSTIILPIARVLEYAHKEGIVHRDINPNIIFIQEHKTNLCPIIGSWKTAHFSDHLPHKEKTPQNLTLDELR